MLCQDEGSTWKQRWKCDKQKVTNGSLFFLIELNSSQLAWCYQVKFFLEYFVLFFEIADTRQELLVCE